ncbi:hypothetical protein XANCAGTX0491_007429 [Xanthoria calcicola]
MEPRDSPNRFITKYQESFGKIRDRIERKRQEVQGLSDGLFAASSVAEGRLATEQSGNIRLLTLVTIPYLPLNLATMIYGMNALPNSADLVSYVVVTVILCAITYILVLNLPFLKIAVSWGRGRIRRMVRPRKKTGIKANSTKHETTNSTAYGDGNAA